MSRTFADLQLNSDKLALVQADGSASLLCNKSQLICWLKDFNVKQQEEIFF